ncbi:hypothetical protein L0244_38685 [bacterium]|nr:hypothetical protein [bacterium]
MILYLGTLNNVLRIKAERETRLEEDLIYVCITLEAHSRFPGDSISFRFHATDLSKFQKAFKELEDLK